MDEGSTKSAAKKFPTLALILGRRLLLHILNFHPAFLVAQEASQMSGSKAWTA